MTDGRIKRAVKHYGIDSQRMMAIEEMSELIKELSKNKRGQDNIDAIAEEIADVEIMTEQLKIIYNCHLKVDYYKECKLKRLEERMDEDKEKS